MYVYIPLMHFDYINPLFCLLISLPHPTKLPKKAPFLVFRGGFALLLLTRIAGVRVIYLSRGNLPLAAELSSITPHSTQAIINCR